MTTEDSTPDTSEAIRDVATADLEGGGELLAGAAEAADEALAATAVGTAEVVRGSDELAVSEALGSLGESEIADGLRDGVQAAVALDASEEAAGIGALMAAVEVDNLDRAMVLASISGQLGVAGEVADLLRMPVFAAFLDAKGRQLHGLAVNEIGRAMAAGALSDGLEDMSERLAALGLDELAEGVESLETADALLDARDDAAASGLEHTADGMAELAVAAGRTQAARQLAGAGVVMVAQGAEEAGAAEGLEAGAARAAAKAPRAKAAKPAKASAKAPKATAKGGKPKKAAKPAG
jgi:hypothetical protein